MSRLPNYSEERRGGARLATRQASWITVVHFGASRLRGPTPPANALLCPIKPNRQTQNCISTTPIMQALAAPSLARLARPFRPVCARQRPSSRQCTTFRHSLTAPRASASSSSSSSPPTSQARSAKEAVELGLEAFQTGDAQAALALFVRAQQLSPDEDEARAACYNAACAQTRLRQWEAAVDSIRRAVNDYNLKLSVALNDPDLEALRERREWLAALSEMRGAQATCSAGGQGIAYSRKLSKQTAGSGGMNSWPGVCSGSWQKVT